MFFITKTSVMCRERSTTMNQRNQGKQYFVSGISNADNTLRCGVLNLYESRKSARVKIEWRGHFKNDVLDLVMFSEVYIICPSLTVLVFLSNLLPISTFHAVFIHWMFHYSQLRNRIRYRWLSKYFSSVIEL